MADTALATGATAVLAFSDYVALGALARFDELGVAVPEEVSLTGFDDISLSSLVSPRLTTVAVDKQRLGRHAWELFADSADQEPGVVTVTPRLIVQGSTA